jgi:hypothetical protein
MIGPAERGAHLHATLGATADPFTTSHLGGELVPDGGRGCLGGGNARMLAESPPPGPLQRRSAGFGEEPGLAAYLEPALVSNPPSRLAPASTLASLPLSVMPIHLRDLAASLPARMIGSADHGFRTRRGG